MPFGKQKLGYRAAPSGIALQIAIEFAPVIVDTCPMIDMNTFRLRSFALCALGAALGGCSAFGDTSDDARQIGKSVLALIDQRAGKVCIDSRTRGEPLAIFRTMIVAPDPARRPLMWRPPTSVGSGDQLTGRELINSQFSGLHPILPEPSSDVPPLPAIEQMQLNALARQLSVRETQRVSLDKPDEAPTAKLRWWAINRFDRSCKTLVRLSNPVIAGNNGFVSVVSGHWGATFALRRTGKDWQVVARWTDWLY